MAPVFLLKWLLGQVMAVHLKKILGDLLYLEEPDQTKDHLPSPEDLRNKVALVPLASVVGRDPHVFGPSGSRSISQRYGSGSGSFPFLIKVLIKPEIMLAK